MKKNPSNRSNDKQAHIHPSIYPSIHIERQMTYHSGRLKIRKYIKIDLGLVESSTSRPLYPPRKEAELSIG
jgi:hypothetical protein